MSHWKEGREETSLRHCTKDAADWALLREGEPRSNKYRDPLKAGPVLPTNNQTGTGRDFSQPRANFAVEPSRDGSSALLVRPWYIFVGH